MTIFDYLNQFYEWKADQGKVVSDAATGFYFFVLKEANRQFWPELIEVRKKDVMLANGWGSNHTYIKARDGLVENGLIEIVRAGKNEATPILLRLLITVRRAESAHLNIARCAESAHLKNFTYAESAQANESMYADNAHVGGRCADNAYAENAQVKNSSYADNAHLNDVSYAESAQVKGTIGVNKTFLKLSLENIDVVKSKELEFYEKGEVPEFVKANRQKLVEGSNPQPPSSQQIKAFLLSSIQAQEHVRRNLKPDSYKPEEYETIVDHFLSYNAGTEYKSTQHAFKHFFSTISSWNGKNLSKSTKHDASKRKPSQRSGPLVPLPAKDLGTYASHVHLADLDEAELERLCGITGGGTTGTDTGGNPPDAKG